MVSTRANGQWSDSTSSLPARGGGIQRIFFNQERFAQAVRDTIETPVTDPERVLAIAPAPVTSSAKMEKDAIALIAKEFDLTPKLAEAALQATGGDVRKTMLELSKPIGA